MGDDTMVHVGLNCGQTCTIITNLKPVQQSFLNLILKKSEIELKNCLASIGIIR